jgi:hypothetical protein
MKYVSEKMKKFWMQMISSHAVSRDPVKWNKCDWKWKGNQGEINTETRKKTKEVKRNRNWKNNAYMKEKKLQIKKKKIKMKSFSERTNDDNPIKEITWSTFEI